MNHTRHRTRTLGATIALLALAFSGCATRTEPILNPALPRTALQWVIVYNGALAKTNRSVEQSVETVQKAGALTVNQARPVIIACGRVAAVSESVRAITSAGTEATWAVDGPKIRDVLFAANLSLPASTNPVVDVAISTVRAALLLLTSEVK